MVLTSGDSQVFTLNTYFFFSSAKMEALPCPTPYPDLPTTMHRCTSKKAQGMVTSGGSDFQVTALSSPELLGASNSICPSGKASGWCRACSASPLILSISLGDLFLKPDTEFSRGETFATPWTAWFLCPTSGFKLGQQSVLFPDQSLISPHAYLASHTVSLKSWEGHLRGT